MASPPEPATGTWEQRKVTVTADPIPTGSPLTFSIVGRSLGCSVDSDGLVSIGSKPGTITVRVRASKRNYDEVKITITKYKAPATDVGGTAESTIDDGMAAGNPFDEL